MMELFRGSLDIDEIVAKSDDFGGEILEKFRKGEIFHVQRASDGRLVFLDKGKFEYIAEYRVSHPYSSLGDVVRGGAIKSEIEFPNLLERVIREGTPTPGIDSTGNPFVKYILNVGNNRTISISTAPKNGWITTIFPN